MADERVLLIDDNKDFTDVLSQRMESRGMKVQTADSGSLGLEKAEHVNYDAIVLDLAMPGMDGLETLARMRAKNPDLQVILLTGHGTIDKGIEAIKLGAMDFLQKPVDFSILQAKIKEAKANRMVLVQKRAEASIQDILGSKGW